MSKCQGVPSHSVSALMEAAQSIGSVMNLTAMLDHAVEHAVRHTGADRASLWLLDASGSHLQLAAFCGTPPTSAAESMPQAVALADDVLAHEVVASGRPVFVRDATSDPRTARRSRFSSGEKSILVVPVLSQAEVLGTLMVNYVRDFHEVTASDIDIVQAAGNRVGMAIANLRYLAQEQARGRIRNTFLKVSQAILSHLELYQVLDTILEQVRPALASDSACIRLLSDGTFRVVAARGYQDAERVLSLIFVPGENSVDSYIMRSRQPVLCRDVRSETRFYWRAAEAGVQSWMGLPLIGPHGLLGLLSLDRYKEPAFTAENLATAALFANQITIAIENSYLSEEAEQYALEAEWRAEVLRIVRDIAELISSTVNLQQILQTAVNMLGHALKAERATVALLDASGTHLDVVAEHMSAGGTPALGLRIPVRAREFKEFIANLRRPLAIGDTLGYPSLASLRPLFEAYQVKSLLLVPFIIRGQVMGGFGLTRGPEQQDFGTEDIELAKIIANQVCVAVENARLLEASHRSAEYVSEASHELRTPLTLIKGFVGTLLRPELSLSLADQQHFLHRINEATDRLGRLMDDMLTVSRIQVGSFEIRRRPMDLRAAIEHVVEVMRRPDDTHILSVQVSAASVLIQADPERIEQVLINLVNNALKYTPQGTRIIIQARRLETESDLDDVRHTCPEETEFPPLPLALVTVADEGPGIAPEYQAHIFERFYRVPRVGAEQIPGMGLGLYICKSIVEAHGGIIWLDTTVSRRTAFHFVLPAEA